MQIIHSDRLQEDERRGMRALIHSNVIIGSKVLLKIMQEENMHLEDERTKAYTDLIAPTRPNMVDDTALTDMDVKHSIDFVHKLHIMLAHSVLLGRVLSAMNLKTRQTASQVDPGTCQQASLHSHRQLSHAAPLHTTKQVVDDEEEEIMMDSRVEKVL
jgi:hypothetical protein